MGQRMNTEPLDLWNFVERYDQSQAPLDTLEAELRAGIAAYQLPAPESADFETVRKSVMMRRDELARQLYRLKDELFQEMAPLRIAGLGRLLAAAWRLLRDNPSGEAGCCFFAGFRLWELDKYAEALPLLARAQELAGDDAEASTELYMAPGSLRVECLIHLHAYEEAARQAEDLVRRSRKEETLQGYCVNNLVNLGWARHESGKLPEALQAFREAQTRRRGLTAQDYAEQRVMAEARQDLLHGLAARGSRAYEEAFERLESARAGARESNPALAAMALSEIGITWEFVGERSRGMEILGQAAREAERLERPHDAARWGLTPLTPEALEKCRGMDAYVQAVRLALFGSNSDQEHALARKLVLRALEDAREKRNLRLETIAQTLLARLYLRAGRLYQALSAQEWNVTLAERLDDPAYQLQAWANLGDIHLRMDRVEKGEVALRKALEIGQKARAMASTMELRQALGAGLTEVYESLGFCLATHWEANGQKVRDAQPEELLELSQQARAANCAAWLATEAALRQAEAEDLYPLLLSLRATEVSIEAAALKGARGGFQQLFQEHEQRRQALREAAAGRGLATLEPPVFSTSELATSLHAGECLIDLFALRSGVGLVALEPNGRAQVRLAPWPVEARLDFLRRWRTALRTAAGADDLLPLLHELERVLLDALVGLLTDAPERLLLCPQCELSLLPFWQLAERLPGIRISLVPGVGASKLLRLRPAAAAGRRLWWGDSTGSLVHAAKDLQARADFVPLPANLEESLPQLADAEILHVGSHGEFHERDPYHSGVVAQRARKPRPGPFAGRSRYGEEMLTVAEVAATLHLPGCRLVTLAGCSTGLPRQHPASEQTGLPVAFLIAGARNVVASLWPVNDGAASLLMQLFYESLSVAQTQQTPSVALARARTALRRMPRPEVLARLGSSAGVPLRERPYDAPQHHLAFAHFGVE
jgi:tetratricopeptide (TPR) repeat protein